MSVLDKQLAALIGSRICHDLISPIGAINNGLELLEMSGQSLDTPELALIRESCEMAQARIRFFRIAFGASKPDQTLPTNELTEAISALNKGARVTLSWEGQGTLTRRAAQLLCLSALCLETALPRGGQISLHSDGCGTLVARATGQIATPLPDIWQVFEAEDITGTDITPAQVHFKLLHLLLADQGKRPQTQVSDSTLTLTLIPA